MKSFVAYHSTQAVPVVDEVNHARSPVLDLVGLCVLLSPAVPEPALGQGLGDDVHGPQVDLQVLGVLRVTADRLCRTPGSSA